MPGSWSALEVEAIVADYLAMLQAELSGVPFNKAAHNRRLRSVIGERTKGSIERKHANISAVMIELGMPYIDGYKPFGNYQQRLFDTVAERLSEHPELLAAATNDLTATIAVPSFDDILSAMVDPPRRERGSVGEQRTEPIVRKIPRPAINYLELEARNRDLGLVGEHFVLNFERARLVLAGADRLAAQIEHVAITKGDGEGYDILSFEVNGRERLIEVKTTKYGAQTPFFVSQNELTVSQRESKRYHLYRPFGMKKVPKLFRLPGAISATCLLSPVSYSATVL